MKTEHTPGPWEVRDGKLWAPLQLTYIADLRNPCDNSPEERAKHDADCALLAAAPDLLAALKMLVIIVGMACPSRVKALDAAEDAIAKARGGKGAK